MPGQQVKAKAINQQLCLITLRLIIESQIQVQCTSYEFHFSAVLIKYLLQVIADVRTIFVSGTHSIKLFLRRIIILIFSSSFRLSGTGNLGNNNKLRQQILFSFLRNTSKYSELKRRNARSQKLQHCGDNVCESNNPQV